jgi:hypothetical protein
VRRGGRWTEDWIGCWTKLDQDGGGRYFVGVIL